MKLGGPFFWLETFLDTLTDVKVAAVSSGFTFLSFPSWMFKRPICMLHSFEFIKMRNLSIKVLLFERIPWIWLSWFFWRICALDLRRPLFRKTLKFFQRNVLTLKLSNFSFNSFKLVRPVSVKERPIIQRS